MCSRCTSTRIVARNQDGKIVAQCRRQAMMR
ncbi:hypothetical protein K663_03125 [Sphingobium sp. MI1205]|nr:hypothetical protein K663_03125 [Sphingobium sp. MI1205]